MCSGDLYPQFDVRTQGCKEISYFPRRGFLARIARKFHSFQGDNLSNKILETSQRLVASKIDRALIVSDIINNFLKSQEGYMVFSEKLAGRRIALIGGAGFIGHNLALSLAQQGAEVSVIDSLHVNNLLSFVCEETKVPNRKFYSNIANQRLNLLQEANIPVYVQDARDYHAQNKILNVIKPQVIVLLAAVAHADRSNKDPYGTFDHSLRTLENALDYSRGNVEQFVYFSSSMIYGNFKGGTVTEETLCEPIGIYGALKFAGEKMVIAYNQTFDLPYTIIRPSALYGERCVSRRIGQIFIENAMQGAEVAVHGDGSDRLDFTYVGDLVHGVSRVIESPNAINQTFNITYGESRSISDMADILKKHFPEVTVRYLPKDKLMPARGTLSVEKARSMIGYNPGFPLEVGFLKYINWYKQTFESVLGKRRPTVILESDEQEVGISNSLSPTIGEEALVERV